MRPSLALIPCAHEPEKLYSVIPEDGTGDFTVSRNGTGTRVNKDGLIESMPAHVPRFNYDPITGEFLGVLVEPAATNLIEWSEDFSNSYWLKSSSTVISNQTISPDGQTNADIYTSGSSGFPRLTSPNFTFLANTDYYLSVFYENVDALYLSVSFLENISNYIQINLSNNLLFRSGGAISLNSLKNFGNGWFFLSVKIRYAVNTTSAFFFRLSTFTSPDEWEFNKSIYLWGAQLSTVDSFYIPTTTAQVTRPADIISRTGVADLIGQTEGGLYSEFNISDGAGFVNIMTLYGDASNLLNIQSVTSNNFRVSMLDSDGTTTTPTYPGTLLKNKILISYNSAHIKLFINGELKHTLNKVVSFSNPLTEIRHLAANRFFNIQKSLVFNSTISDSQAIQLTTL